MCGAHCHTHTHTGDRMGGRIFYRMLCDVLQHKIFVYELVRHPHFASGKNGNRKTRKKTHLDSVKRIKEKTHKNTHTQKPRAYEKKRKVTCSAVIFIKYARTHFTLMLNWEFRIDTKRDQENERAMNNFSV